MTFQDPGARAPVDIQVRLRGGPPPPIPFNIEDEPEYKAPEKAATGTAAPAFDIEAEPAYKAPPPTAAEQQQAPDAGFFEKGGAGEAGLKGGIEGATFGFAPTLAGLREAAGPDVNDFADKHLPLPLALGVKHAVGAARLLNEAVQNHLASGDQTQGVHQDVLDAYKRGRDAAGANQQALQETHPVAYTLGQLAGSVAAPVPGLGGAASVGGRLARAATQGALGGGLYGAGTAISEGQAPLDVAKSAAQSAGTGALFGGATGGALEAASGTVGKVASMVRGARDVDAEAARKVVDALRADYERAGQQWTPEMIDVANQAGVPRHIIDSGGERTRALARAAANANPEARAALNELTDSRLQQQAPRIAGFIKQITGGADAGADRIALEQAGRVANAKNYTRSYAAGDRPIWSKELERLTASPSVTQALRNAQAKWGDWQVLDGFGAANPPVRMGPGGTVHFTNSRGIATFPNLQYWDYAARDLAEKAEKATGNYERARFGGLANALKDELDRQVPEYQGTRATAASFFGARDSSTAGENFVMGGQNINDARRMLAQMTGPERELFARGFASKLSDLVEQAGRTVGTRSVLNQIFVDSPKAKQKIALALGTDRANQLETMFRVENLVDQARKALLNSTTIRQGLEAGLVATGAAGFEGLKERKLDAATIITGALAAGATVGARHGVKIIDEKVTRRIGEMLASNDPAVLSKGIAIVSKRPVLFNAIRAATGAGSRVATHDIGFGKAAAGLAATLSPEGGAEEE